MPVVLMTAFATVATAVEAMKLGAYDYIQKPFDGEEIKLLVDRTPGAQPAAPGKPGPAQHDRDRRQPAADRQRPLMDEVRRKIELVARSNATVLIRGESGTGKEVVARAVHLASARRDKPDAGRQLCRPVGKPSGIGIVRP